ncbi:MAG: hypothetical protein AAF566_00755 [Pseudomonadota bacterium]
MANDWILDVLRDLRRFADLNELPELSQQLGIATETAARELDPKSSGSTGNGWEVHATDIDGIFAVAAVRDA